MIGYIPGGFDLLHADHRLYISRCIAKGHDINIKSFCVLLHSDRHLSKKGITRPFLSYDQRRQDILDAFPNIQVEPWRLVGSGAIFTVKMDAGATEYDLVVLLDSGNTVHTTSIEAKLLQQKNLSGCHWKRSAILLRDGNIVTCRTNVEQGGCDVCPKGIAYRAHENHLIVPCDFMHAEESCLLESLPGDTLISSLSPCMKCAELCVKSRIKRFVYLEAYRDLSGVDLMRSAGIQVRKAGI